MSTRRRRARLWCVIAGLSAALLPPQPARAAEHHFGFTYESSVLNPGVSEVQPWTTVRAGRVAYYSRLDAQLGFETGLAKGLQGALFWNFWKEAADVTVPSATQGTQATRIAGSGFESLTLNLKYKFSDPIADAVGTALYAEGTIGPQLAGGGGRLIMDKQIGALLFAANLGGGSTIALDQRTSFEGSFTEILSVGYFVTPAVFPSLELRNENAFSKALERSILHAGPSLSVVGERAWATLAVDPQIAAFKGKTAGHSLELDQNERLQVRLLLGLRL